MSMNKKFFSITLSSLLVTTGSLGVSAIHINDLNTSTEEVSGVVSSMSPIGQIIDGTEITAVIDMEHREREDGLIDLVDPTSRDVWFVLEVHE